MEFYSHTQNETRIQKDQIAGMLQNAFKESGHLEGIVEKVKKCNFNQKLHLIEYRHKAEDAACKNCSLFLKLFLNKKSE